MCYIVDEKPSEFRKSEPRPVNAVNLQENRSNRTSVLSTGLVKWMCREDVFQIVRDC